MTVGYGLDFGTTNSAIAVADDAGLLRLARFDTPEGAVEAFRSVLFFGREDPRAPVEKLAGPVAIARYLEFDEDRRLMQSLKSFLASPLFTGTRVYGTRYTLEDLLGEILRPLKRACEIQLGAVEGPLVAGRPVQFVRAKDDADEQLALRRLEAALWEAELDDVVFEYEPVAAAYHYERDLDRDELVLIADFGGGTSDFCLLRVGPSHRGRADRQSDILGTAGVPLAGDAFDAKIVRHAVAPLLGQGSLHQVFLGQQVPIPNWIYHDLERWHHLSFLKSRKTLGFLYEILDGSLEPQKIEALLALVERDLGYALYRSVQDAKADLSRSDHAWLRFVDPPIEIERRIERAEFEAWIDEELAAIRSCVDGLFAIASVDVSEVDRVFLTGGSAFVPAVRAIFSERFGVERLRGGAELTSVASGLALRARDLRTGRAA